jgi:hypothetical protein
LGRDSSVKEGYSNHQPSSSLGLSPLKESFAINRLEKSALKNDLYSKELGCFKNNEVPSLRAKEEKENKA